MAMRVSGTLEDNDIASRVRVAIFSFFSMLELLRSPAQPLFCVCTNIKISKTGSTSMYISVWLCYERTKKNKNNEVPVYNAGR